ncbi:RNA polymerase II-associated protein 3 isoform X1 [Cherax quadricarinatus]|nr:RNA polymerase II-associated protein 3-like isoform X1 [Cherax quadricarinatus]
MDTTHNSSLMMQRNIKENSEALKDFLEGLNDWEREMKVVDEKLCNQAREDCHSPETCHPVRCKKTLEISSGKETTGTMPSNNRKTKDEGKNIEKPKKISTCDYAAWEKFDVDTALASSSEEEEEIERQSDKKHMETKYPKTNKKERALALKEAGNKFYSSGQLDNAIAKYTQGMALDPTNAVLPANRAMAYIKLKKYTAAEADCNKCLKLDAGYIKAYLRRATSRVNLGKKELAIKDYQKVLELEPWNKEAKKELENLQCAADVKCERTEMSVKYDCKIKAKQESTVSKQPLMNESQKQETNNVMHQNQKDNVCGNTTNLDNDKKKQGGKKLQIVEVNSKECNSVNVLDPDGVLPIEKPPHLRSLKPLKKIPVVDIATKASILECPLLLEVEGTTVKKHPVPSVAEHRVPSMAEKDTSDKKEYDAVGTLQEDPGRATLQSQPENKSQASVSLPSAPRTSHQFTEDWNKLSHQVSQAIKYLKIIQPKFFTSADLDADTLISVISTLRTEEISPLQAAQYILAFSQSSGFSVNIMFLNESQKKVIYDVISKCEEEESYNTQIRNLKNLLDNES